MKHTDIPYNKMTFTPKEAEQCADFVKYLMQMKSADYYNEICITSDGYCTIVCWTQKSYDDSYGGGSFEFVDEDQDIWTDEEIDEIVKARIENQK